jgi:hypothetical protein
LRFLLKNIRELLDIQLYQAYSKPDTVTVSSPTYQFGHQQFSGNGATRSSNNGKHDPHNDDGKGVKRSGMDRKSLLDRRTKLDDSISDLTGYINRRLSLTQQAMQVLALNNLLYVARPVF